MAASWALQPLPGQVVEHQRGKLIRTLREARDLTVEVQVGSSAPLVWVRDGQRLLVEIPTGGAG
jgi:hypothetical protein